MKTPSSDYPTDSANRNFRSFGTWLSLVDNIIVCKLYFNYKKGGKKNKIATKHKAINIIFKGLPVEKEKLIYKNINQMFPINMYIFCSCSFSGGVPIVRDTAVNKSFLPY